MSNPSSITGCTFWIDPSDSNAFIVDPHPDIPGYYVYTGLVNKMSTNNIVYYNSSFGCTGPIYLPGYNTSTLSYYANTVPLATSTHELLCHYDFNHTNFTLFTVIDNAYFNNSSSNTPLYFFFAPSSLAFGYYNSTLAIATGNGSSFYSPGFAPVSPSFNTSEKHVVFTATYSNNTLQTYINNSLCSSHSGSIGTFPQFHLGAHRGSNGGATMMSDFLIYNSSLNSDQRYSINKYLLQKYNIIADQPFIFPRPKVKPTSIEFWWSKPPSVSTFNVPVTHYNLERVISNNSNFSTFVNSNINRFAIQNLTTGSLYNYRLFALNSNNLLNSNPVSNYRSVYLSAPPDPPTNPSFSLISGNYYTISWTNPNSQNLYSQLGTNLTAYPLDGNGNLISTLNLLIRASAPTTFTNATMAFPSGSNYKVLIQAVNDAGYSAKTCFTSTISVA